ncbi:MAG: aminotransferase class I/II-fold pyridoxal phosphate-dependent enzyme [Spirochaetes bacterium]|nr:aminotransferase class I/II-fold pyridoxal phosphate-dependent enzyme [Spirochaetota bacterium]
MIAFRIDNSVSERNPVRKLEERLEDLIPLKHFIITGFARNGLFLLVKACKWEKAEIIVPAFTCSIIRHTIEEAGAVPVPVDSEDNGINIDPRKIERAITPLTRALYVVHTYGTAAQIEAIAAIAKKHRLMLIEDLAHAPFALYNDKPLGTFGDFAILSFTKKIINYEGGSIGTNNTTVYKKMLLLQKEYQRSRSISLNFFIDNYVRLVGSWWETKFSPAALLLMKLNDIINVVIHKGAYGIKIDHERFHPSTTACRITIRQLDSLFKKYRDEDKTASQKQYFTGTVMEQNRLYRLLSFRTWRNSNSPGLYPRADYLYSNYRIFSKAIHLFGQLTSS